MPYLTFGEQVKIVLSRRGMTIKELAEIIEERTGKKTEVKSYFITPGFPPERPVVEDSAA